LILIFFIAALVYLGLLAFSSKTGSLPYVFTGDLLSGCLLAIGTVAAVAGAIVTRNHRHHPHH
jgi:hypothetical protein